MFGKLLKFIKYSTPPLLCSIFFSFFINYSNTSAMANRLPAETLQFYSKNDILYYNPLGNNIDCASNSFGYTGQSYIMDSTVNPWYAEGDYAGIGTTGHYNGLKGTVYLDNNDEAFETIQADEDLGGLEYIYGERWTPEWDSWPYGLIPSSNQTSTTKYYLVVLPENVYGYKALETFVATFEKLPNPIYFIVIDVHAEEHQTITSQARSNPNFAGGTGLLGALTSHAGNPTLLYEATGGITSLHRITGETTDNIPILKEKNSSNSKITTSSSSSGDCTHTVDETSFIVYDQKSSSYSTQLYGSTSEDKTRSSVSTSACGPFSFAMLANALGVPNIDPIAVTQVAGDGGMHVSGGSSHEITKYLSDHYQMFYEKINTGFNDGTMGNTLTNDEKTSVESKITDYLKHGWMIHSSGKGSSPFTSGGHYIGIRGITSDGRWLIADSNGDDGKENSNKEWDPNVIVSAGLNVGNLHAIKASTLSPCGNLTTSSICGNIGSSHRNLTYEESEKLVKHYLSSDAPGDYKLSVNGKWNCVSLSYYFLQKLTTIGILPGDYGSMGNGKDVTTYISDYFKLPVGTEPKPFAIFSITAGRTICEDGHICGHTGMITAVNDDTITFIEASYGDIGYASVREKPPSYFKNTKHPNALFVYTDSIFNANELNLILQGR